MLRICDRACSKFLRQLGLKVRYNIYVGSSEALDAIFEECGVTLPDRAPLISMLKHFQKASEHHLFSEKDENQYRRFFNQLKEHFKDRVECDIHKLLSLMKINGTVE